MNHTSSKRASFGSKIGIILASAGSAVGLGNIWRFPTETGNNGGAAFLLIYLVCILLLGVPVMISEFIVGRRSHANTASAYRIITGTKRWQFIGFLGVLNAFLILGYYNVVAGWTLEYAYQSAFGHFAQGMDYGAMFTDFVSSPWRPVLYLVIFMLMTHVVIVRGVKDGIEMFSKIMMPLLFLIIVLLCVCAFFMPGTGEGLRFFLQPDFSKVTATTVLSAMGQAFFTLSLGMGCLCTYASYFDDKTNLVRTAFSVAGIDTVIAVMAGLIIFPAVYSVPGLTPDAGPGLVFITLPNVFQIAFQQMPVVGYVFSLAFYCLLILAALTSTISLHEVVTVYVHEVFHLRRRTAATLVSLSLMIIGTFCALSFGVLSDIKVFDMTFFDLFDFTTAKLMLPVTGLFIALFAGWILKPEMLREEITNRSSLTVRTFRIYQLLLRYVAPVAIVLIIVHQLFL